MDNAASIEQPRIHVACLAAYNNGVLHGAWINADQKEEAVHREIAAMLKASPIAGAEEFAIHDYEGFEGARIEEYSAIAKVVDLAGFVAEHGALGGAVLNHFSRDLSEASQALEDGYFGKFNSLAHYVEQVTSEAYGDKIPEAIHFYIDWEAMARDAELNGDVFTMEMHFDEVQVFSGR